MHAVVGGAWLYVMPGGFPLIHPRFVANRALPASVVLISHHPIGSIVLSDWASQVSTDLSPTAGWMVAQNAIEFSLGGEIPHSIASLFISLASTSVGRGFDTVGHAPGVYRNRMAVRLLAP